jgi:CBS domain-containing protein
MPHKKKVREVMIPLKKYPHIPHWFNLRQAVAIVRETSFECAGAFEPRTLLVFDEKHKLVGILTLRDLLKGLEPGFYRERQLILSDPTFKIEEGELLGPGMRKQAGKPVSEVMGPVKVSIKADESLAKAIFVMVQENVGMMPVMEEDQVVGMVRLTDLFMEVSQAILDEIDGELP